MISQCLKCGEEFITYPSQNKRYCSYKCANEAKKKALNKCLACGKEVKRSDTKYCSLKCFHQSVKGIAQPKRWVRITKKCAYCGKDFQAGGRSGKHKEAKFCSQKCQFMASRKPLGEQYCLTDSAHWKDIRKRILLRDKHQCRLCGSDKRKLEVHHIIPRSEEANHNDENLISLCGRCHFALEVMTINGYHNKKSFDPWVIINSVN